MATGLFVDELPENSEVWRELKKTLEHIRGEIQSFFEKTLIVGEFTRLWDDPPPPINHFYIGPKRSWLSKVGSWILWPVLWWVKLLSGEKTFAVSKRLVTIAPTQREIHCTVSEARFASLVERGLKDWASRYHPNAKIEIEECILDR